MEAMGLLDHLDERNQRRVDEINTLYVTSPEYLNRSKPGAPDAEDGAAKYVGADLASWAGFGCFPEVGLLALAGAGIGLALRALATRFKRRS